MLVMVNKRIMFFIILVFGLQLLLYIKTRKNSGDGCFVLGSKPGLHAQTNTNQLARYRVPVIHPSQE